MAQNSFLAALGGILGGLFSTGAARAALPANIPRVAQSIPRRDSLDNLLDRIAMAESSGNPNARATTSTASGLFQFTDGTWRLVVNKWGKQTGIGLQDKNNPTAQRRMARLLLEDNVAGLRRLIGRAPTNQEIYVAHFAGVAGAAKLIRNPSASAAQVLPDAARANRTIFYGSNGAPRSSRDVISLLGRKVS